MRASSRYLAPLIAVFLLWGGTAFATVVVQCPTLTDPLDPTSIDYTGGTFVDLNGDGAIRADTSVLGTPEIINPVSPNQVCIHVAAGDGLVNMADGREQYIFSYANATDVNDDTVMQVFNEGAEFPAPTITLKEGDDLYWTLTNVGMNRRPDLFDPHTIHFHGFKNASSIFDGVPDVSISINMGASLTYFYHVVDPGTYIWHCHVEATEHMQMGMIGNIYVTPAQDGTLLGGFTKFAYNDGDGSTGYDVAYELQFTEFDPTFHDNSRDVQPLPFADMDDKYPMINGRGYPDTVNPAGSLPYEHGAFSPLTSLITASAGQRVLLRLSSVSTTSYHTIGLIGLKMKVIGIGSAQLAQPYMANSVRMAGGDTIEVLVDIPLTAALGQRYFVYATDLDSLSNNTEDYGGMMTEILIQ